MCSASDKYWECEIGKELTCKCGKLHYKERRLKSSTCKECLTDRCLNRLLIDLDKFKRGLFRSIGVWACTYCGIIKPDSEFPGGKGKSRCTCCANRLRRENYTWKTTPQKREWKRLSKHGIQTDIQLIVCADCGEYEVRKSSFFIGCFCKKCFLIRDKRSKARVYYMESYNPIAECTHCGNSFIRQLQSQKVCCLCTTKRKAIDKRRERQRYRSIQRGGRVKGVSYDPYNVFNRDKWRCYICGVKTQKKDIYVDNAAEIDHVIPLSKGGKDIPSNVKCCCRKCNNDKADKIIPLTGNLFCQIDTG